ncbi:nucleotide-diphospho-sugar transferase [Gorgonomyces haynaldii]|nr:nucleotide-diphospho-sugar transferase [Gorgonomyces haynaldii]
MGKEKTKALQAEVQLQAVVITDSFNSRFKPLTLDTPRSLLPVCNIPVLNYCLEFLVANQVDQIIVVAGSHSDQIREHIQELGIKNIDIFVSQHHRSIGDVLRDLDSKQVLVSDFVLVNGDLVADFDLQRAVQEHRDRKEKDKNSIMTMVLKQASQHHRSRFGGEALFWLDQDSKECLSYEHMGTRYNKRKTSIPSSLFKQHPTIRAHNDLLDCQVDICSLEVPALFTENFDYQDMRQDFLKGIIESELLTKTIYAHILTNGYASNCSSQYMYDIISKDVMNRWVYPLVPENRNLTDELYVHSKPNNYTASDVHLSRTCVIKSGVTIGSNTRVGEKTVIKNSVIGSNCHISDNVLIENAYIFNNTVIHNDCKIQHSIVAGNVIIKDHVVLQKGCLIGSQVVLGPEVTLEPFTAVCCQEGESESNPLLGEESVGVIYEPSDDEDEEDEVLDVRLGADPVPELEEPVESEEEEAEEDEDGDDWEQEVKQTIERAFDESHDVDIAALELNTLKMAMNITFGDLRQIVLPSLLDRTDPQQSAVQLRKFFGKWGLLLEKFTHSEQDQIHLLDILGSYCLEHPGHQKIYLFMIKLLYQMDILENESILDWHQHQDGGVIADLLQPFVDWLNESDEEDD